MGNFTVRLRSWQLNTSSRRSDDLRHFPLNVSRVSKAFVDKSACSVIVGEWSFTFSTRRLTGVLSYSLSMWRCDIASNAFVSTSTQLQMSGFCEIATHAA